MVVKCVLECVILRNKIMESGICSNGKNLLVIFGGKVGIGVGNITFHHEDGLEEKYQTLFLQQCVNQHELARIYLTKKK